MTDRLLTVRDVMQAVGFGKTWIYQQIDAGRFPAPIKFSAKCVRWRESDLEQWMDALPRT